MYRLVEAGIVDPARYVQIGLRGYWPGEEEFGWQAERGITSFFVMHDVRRLGIEQVVRETIGVVGAGPVFLSVDAATSSIRVRAGNWARPSPAG